MKEAFTTRCASLLLAYRRQCAASTAPTQVRRSESSKYVSLLMHRYLQLILPEAYKLLPVYGLGLLKDVTLKGSFLSITLPSHSHSIDSGGSSISSDLRNCGAQALRTMGAGALIGHVYPTMLSIHDLSSDVGVPNAETGWIPLPLHMRPTYMSMEPHGVYLIGEKGLKFKDNLLTPNQTMARYLSSGWAGRLRPSLSVTCLVSTRLMSFRQQ